MKKLLIVADRNNSGKAIARGLDYAKRMNLQPQVLVFAWASLKGVESIHPNSSAPVKKALLEKQVQAAREHIRKHSEQANRILVRGVWSKKPEQWLIAHLEKKADEYYGVVALTADPESGVLKQRNWELLRRSPVRVLRVSDDQWSDTHSVMAAVDLGASSRDKKRLNERVIREAIEVSQAHDAKLNLVCAVVVPQLLEDLELINLRSYARDAKEKMQPEVERLCKKFDLKKSQFVLKRGEVDEIITSVAADKKAQLVVMGTVGRRGLAAMVLGNTAEEILEHLHTDVLALQP